MPFNARRGRVKIVESENSNKAKELIGGLKNAFERGESFAKAKQSFINAGYNPQEVEIATQEIRKLLSSTNRPVTTSVETKFTQIPKTSQTKQLPTTSSGSPTRKKGIPKALIIFLVIFLILIVVGAATLGLFWDQWF